MGYRDTTTRRHDQAPAEFTNTSYETRELAWELTQARLDSTRIRFLIETGASLTDAAGLASLDVREILRHPQLRGLRLERQLDASPSV